MYPELKKKELNNYYNNSFILEKKHDKLKQIYF